MTIDLSKDLEKIIHDAVRAGLYAREDDVIRDALLRLKQSLSKAARTSGQRAKRAKAARQKPREPLTPEELDQYMLSIGLLTTLPNPAEDIDDDDPDDAPVVIKGEPLSETIIRERR
jgi:Arc/MetJ-type ribon-helix-helix transcriptional regulator